MVNRDSRIYKCPECGEDLVETETDGLWCNNGCYESEYELWVALQEAKKNVHSVSKKSQ